MLSIKDSLGNNITNTAHIAHINPLRYRGYYYDKETGYYYLQSRYYDPNICRFISADNYNYISNETRYGINAYAYCLNNPVNYSDYSGNTATNNSYSFINNFVEGLTKLFVNGIASAFTMLLSPIITLADILQQNDYYLNPSYFIQSLAFENSLSSEILLPQLYGKAAKGSATYAVAALITEVFVCYDVQTLATILQMDFDFEDFDDYIYLKQIIYKEAFDSGILSVIDFAWGASASFNDYLSKAIDVVNGSYSIIMNKYMSEEMFRAIMKKAEKVGTFSSVISAISLVAQNYGGRYLSPMGATIVAMFDLMFLIFDTVSFASISSEFSLIAGVVSSIGFGAIYEVFVKDLAEILAYNWYLL